MQEVPGTRMSKDELRRRIKVVRDIWGETGALPRYAARHVPKEESDAGIWWRGIIKRATLGQLSPQLVELFDDYFMLWRDTAAPKTVPEQRRRISDEEAIERLNEHLARTGYIPAHGDLDLQGWLMEQRLNAAEGRLSPALRSELDTIAPDWLDPGVRKNIAELQQWQSRFKRVKKFREFHGRLPRPAHPKEHALHSWLWELAQGPIDEFASRALRTAIPEWDEFYEAANSGLSADLIGFIEDLAEFIRSNGEMPNSNANSQTENRLAARLQHYRYLAQYDELGPDERRALDDRFSDWLLPREDGGEDMFRTTLHHAEDVIDSLGRYPLSTDPDDKNASVAAFIREQQLAFKAGTLERDRYAQLNLYLPGWLGEKVDPFDSKPADDIEVAIAVVSELHPGMAIADPHDFSRKVVILLREGSLKE